MEAIKKVHFLGVGGKGMGSLAIALAEAGIEVTGSDVSLYEPMRSLILAANIKIIEGYFAETPSHVEPDAVVIGNVARKENPEAIAWIRSGKTFFSMAEAVRRFLIQDKHSIVFTGTHGKTTMTAWTSFLFSELGLDPSFLIGGAPLDLPMSRLSQGKYFIGEGDEYDSAFFDKGSKFLHYNPSFAAISNIEFDHADIFKDLNHVKASFRKLVALLPGDGLCIAHQGDPVVMELVKESLCPVQTYGFSPVAMWSIGTVEESPQGFQFELFYKRRSLGICHSPLMGRHNLLNLVAGIIAAVNVGVPFEKIRPILSRFRGVRRRQEILHQGAYVLLDDFAHHPTEVNATIKAVRKRFPTGKLWAIFEPRSATARSNVHQETYLTAFDEADEILIADPYRGKDLSDGKRLSSESIAKTLREKGKSAHHFSETVQGIDRLLDGIVPGDVVLVMSNGEFDKIQERLVEKLVHLESITNHAGEKKK